MFGHYFFVAIIFHSPRIATPFTAYSDAKKNSRAFQRPFRSGAKADDLSNGFKKYRVLSAAPFSID